MASSRFPGKPLASILGLPMILHVYERARRCPALSEVVVATCDAEIRDAVEKHGGKVIMTSDKHERGTDRIAEAAESLQADYCINIQGDEPMLYPGMLDLALEPLRLQPDLVCINLMTPLRTPESIRDPNQVKVVVDREGFALYMSREPIPTARYVGNEIPRFKQLGLVLYAKKMLATYRTLPPTPLEKAESVDVMRLIEHGYRIKMVHSPYETYSVDTLADLKFVETKMKDDTLMPSYWKDGAR
jgi:3-deoxy-manno-octulosonate cytidylyltransferase (CMP-KDO synthetase)